MPLRKASRRLPTRFPLPHQLPPPPFPVLRSRCAHAGTMAIPSALAQERVLVQRLRVTHPFHPLSGRQLVCVGERYNRYGTRLLLRADGDEPWSVPRQWTDVVAPDPEIVFGRGRATLRLADLLELADLVTRLRRTPQKRSGGRKDKYAAYVKGTMPRSRIK